MRNVYLTYVSQQSPLELANTWFQQKNSLPSPPLGDGRPLFIHFLHFTRNDPVLMATSSPLASVILHSVVTERRV